jgi:coenzyme F420-0:L-glutamate ligase/coenzyme F420-1:gamma-L-glutamate ligase
VAELATAKLGRRPFTVIRGRSDLVLPAGDHGPGAVALLRPPGEDLFGLGAREAVLAALGARAEDRVVFGAPVPPDELAEVLAGLVGAPVDPADDGLVVDAGDPRARWAVEVAAYAHGWEVAALDGSRIRLRPSTP